jgi:serine/threonine protein phosphatase PrpC
MNEDDTTRLAWVGHSKDIGRKPSQQDEVYVCLDIWPGIHLFAVFDGHGRDVSSRLDGHDATRAR